jgi:hypothetical protein
LTFAVELLVLLSSPIPILEHELTSSFGFVVVVLDAFSAKEKKIKFLFFFSKLHTIRIFYSLII